MKDVEIIGMIKSYISKTLVGMGALKGAPCEVQGVTDAGDGTQTLTLQWKDTAGVTHTTDISLPAAMFEVLSPTNGQTLRYNSVSGKFENSNVSFSADLEDLDNVVITSVQNGQVLTYDAANSRWINADGSTVAALSDLTDVTITTAQNGQLLSYNSASNKWVNVSLTIDDLGHVSITSAQDGQVLTYDAANNVWKNANLPTITVDSALDTTSENPVQNKVIALALDDLSASKIGFDGTTSGLSATDTQGAIDELASEKVDKETGKVLSQNDFTDALKSKLDDIESNAQVNVIEEVQVNGTALTPDANKAVNIEEKVSKLSDVDLTGLADGYILIYDAANNKWIVGANAGASYTAGEGIEIDQNNVISSKMVLFTGTEAQWNALPLADKIKFTHYATNDDQTGQIDPVPTQNSANLMTSGGIYIALQDKANTSDLGTAAAKDSTNVVTAGSSDLVESGAVDTAITSAIEALDVSDTAVAGSYITEVSETDGKVSVTREAADASPTSASNKMVKSGGVYSSEQDIYKINGFLGSKNLVQYPYFYGNAGHTETLNDVDFTINDDLSITIDGTSTNSGEIYYAIKKNIYIKDLKSKNLILSSGGVSGTDVWLGVYEYDQDGTSTVTYTHTTKDADTVAFTLDNTTIKVNVFIRVKALATIDNVTIYPMLRYAEDTDSTYQPYAKTNKQLTDDKAEITQISNPNLLDNPWFTVNQRGITTLSAGGDVYTVDRWMKSASTITFELSSDGSVSLTNTGTATPEWRQRIEPEFAEKFFDGKTFTLSVLKDGVVYSATDVYSYSENKILARIDIGDAYVELRNLPTLTYRCFVRVIFKADTQNKTVSGIQAIKLELGSVSTLAMDTTPNYATELLKCQRYFMRIKNASQTATSYILGMALSTTDVRVAFPVPENMRSDPSIAVSNASDFYYSRNNFSGAVAAANVSSAGPMLGNMKPLIVEGVSLTQSAPYIIYFGPNAYIDFSADL